MRGIGKCSIWTVAAFGFLSALSLLLPSQASAQINIEGLIRGAMQHGYYGGGYRYRSSSHQTRSRSHGHDSAPDKSDKVNEKDATQVESPNNNIPAARPQSAGSAPSPSPDKKQTSAARGSEDQPAFAPSR